jgi:serine/threonine protein kinase/tetratricopeptide (TPR) repeat protein
MTGDIIWRPSSSGPHAALLSTHDGPLLGMLIEMESAWREGREVRAEDFLRRSPEFLADPALSVRLIFEEICLREEAGQVGASAEVLARFPELKSELAVLLECHRLVGLAPRFPEVGEQLGEFSLLAELGRGACGRVFLATQPALADRPIVLKLTSAEGEEHLSLARLRHPHIVPLYLAVEFRERGLFGLCMPYLGGLTLGAMLHQLSDRAAGSLTGRDFLTVLEGCRPPATPGVAPSASLRAFLERSTFAAAACWVAACLADALQAAHERGLVHLDVKPANILIAADAQPMLLDFHLARPPLEAGAPAPLRVGGTPGYMPPEQAQALDAARSGQGPVAPVDGRADVYALGMMLAEMLGAGPPKPDAPTSRLRLRRKNPQVSPGLEALVTRCLEVDPTRRYQTAADVAADLRRHLADLPLQGVRNGSLTEHWRKWRRRRPASLLVASLILLSLGVVADLTIERSAARRRTLDETSADLAAVDVLLGRKQYAEADQSLRRALARVEGRPFDSAVAEAFHARLRLASRGLQAERLHHVAERLRFLGGVEGLGIDETRRHIEFCKQIWDDRRILLESPTEASFVIDEVVREDFIDLILLWTDLEVRSASAGTEMSARKAALERVEAAAKVFGDRHSLVLERRNLSKALGLPQAEATPASLHPETAHEWYSLGRALLKNGEPNRAAQALDRCLALRPQDFWGNFTRGLCAYQLKHWDEAAGYFQTCTALSPDSAECFFNRAAANAAAGRAERALADYTRALELDPNCGRAALNRGLIHFHAGKLNEATADMRRALDLGVDRATGYYNLALIAAAAGDPATAQSYVGRALRHNPLHTAARTLAQRLNAGT